MPIEAFRNNLDVGYCFKDVHIGHYRDGEGFVETWYDVIDANEDYYTFSYEVSTNAQPVYFTVETYLLNIIPPGCTTGYSS